MCNFFSLVSNGKGKIWYFDADLRKRIRERDLTYDNPDSHTSIVDYFRSEICYGKPLPYIDPEIFVNTYEYNPLTRLLTIDDVRVRDDYELVKARCESLDFRNIVPGLRVHPIIHPLRDCKPVKRVTKRDVENLSKWASVKASVRALLWDLVRVLVGDSVKDSVGKLVWDSVGGSVRASVLDSIWGSVWGPVWDSVGDSIWAYITSFFDLGHHVNPYQSCIDLWNRGLIPSFDGTNWRLHTGEDGHIVYKTVL